MSDEKDQRDGKSHVTGLRIDGQHCGRCGRAGNVVEALGRAVTTRCCGFPLCGGYVPAQPWQARANAERVVWACCRGVADRFLGEPTWRPMVATSVGEAAGAGMGERTHETRMFGRPVTMHRAGDWPPVVSDVLVRLLDEDEEASPGWTLVVGLAESSVPGRWCWRRFTGREIFRPDDMVISPS